MKRPSTRASRKRHWLFTKQGGKCYYCQNSMLLLRPPAKSRDLPDNLCTLEHLDDRLSPERGKHAGERRVVAACRRCNHERNKQRELEIPIEVLRERAKRHPSNEASP